MNLFASYNEIFYNSIELTCTGGTRMITKDMVIGQVLRQYPQTAEIFVALGMHCLGCPSATRESVEGAAITHGKNPDDLVAELNKAVGQ
jgi:hybrid cluster-associated redox disulfide protein